MFQFVEKLRFLTQCLKKMKKNTNILEQSKTNFWKSTDWPHNLISTFKNPVRSLWTTKKLIETLIFNNFQEYNKVEQNKTKLFQNNLIFQ